VDLVVDANILFAALIKNSKTSDLLFREELHLFTPEFIFTEFSKYQRFLLLKTHRTKDDFQKLFELFERQISVFPLSEISPYFKKAIKISPDPKDVPYFALAIMLNAAIWSNDKLLKNQSDIKIFSTEDLIEHFE
jgi:predicted nucleic acid-binding protein